MKRPVRIFLILLLITLISVLTGCGSQAGNEGGSGGRGHSSDYPIPEASGTNVYSDGDASIDMSNPEDGYIMVSYEGSADKIMVQITGPDDTEYTYAMKAGGWQVFPLSAGSGRYSINVLSSVTEDMYSIICNTQLDADDVDEFKPFLYPNQYVWYGKGMEAVKLGASLSDQSTDDIDFVTRVYEYVTENISYDDAKAADVPVDYLPDIDETLSTGKGICFDYASLMAAMLRSQGIPTKLEVGYSGTLYHAWISVYTDETGWVDDVIEFDGNDWSLMDPTLASGNSKKSVKDYVDDDSNYIVKYNY